MATLPSLRCALSYRFTYLPYKDASAGGITVTLVTQLTNQWTRRNSRPQTSCRQTRPADRVPGCRGWFAVVTWTRCSARLGQRSRHRRTRTAGLTHQSLQVTQVRPLHTGHGGSADHRHREPNKHRTETNATYTNSDPAVCTKGLCSGIYGLITYLEHCTIVHTNTTLSFNL